MASNILKLKSWNGRDVEAWIDGDGDFVIVDAIGTRIMIRADQIEALKAWLNVKEAS